MTNNSSKNSPEYRVFSVSIPLNVSAEFRKRFADNCHAYHFFYKSAYEYVYTKQKEESIFDTYIPNWMNHITTNVLHNNPLFAWMLDPSKVNPHITDSAFIELYNYLSQLYKSIDSSRLVPLAIPGIGQKYENYYTIFFEYPDELRVIFDHHTYDSQFVLTLPELGQFAIQQTLSDNDKQLIVNPSSMITRYTVSEQQNGLIVVIIEGLTKMYQHNLCDSSEDLGIYCDPNNYSKITLSNGDIFEFPRDFQQLVISIQAQQEKVIKLAEKKPSRHAVREQRQFADYIYKMNLSYNMHLNAFIARLVAANYRYIYYEQPDYYDFNISIDPATEVRIPGWMNFFLRLQKQLTEQKKRTKLIPLPAMTMIRTRCHVCGYDNNFNPDNRYKGIWFCPHCQTEHIIGINAACNLLQFGRHLPDEYKR